MSKLVHGFGINDANYTVKPRIDGRQVSCPFYRSWKSMLQRCYSERTLKRCPTYVECVVCPEWKSFMTFRAWAQTQDWENKQLDKDIVGDGKVYSPQTCCFVEKWLNCLFLDHGRARGDQPLGVHLCNGRYMAMLNKSGQRLFLGNFDTPEEAHQVYLTAKREYVIMKMRDYPDQRIKQAVLDKVK